MNAAPQSRATPMRLLAGGLLAALVIAPQLGLGDYTLHLMVMALLWSTVYTSWSIMGRLGLVSFGHGAFLGIGAYAVVLMWNVYGVSPVARCVPVAGIL